MKSGTAIITGATSGIGASFARELSKRGYNLILTGRRKEKIESLAVQIQEENSIEVEVLFAELSDHQTINMLSEKIRSITDLEFLINNAGFALNSKFHKVAEAKHFEMFNVHALCALKFCYAALPNMIQRRSGAIINVSSLSSFTPFPNNAVYAATKSFINYLTESIHLELMGTGVKVQALCPGMTRTDFHEKMGLDPKRYYKTSGLLKAMFPEEVVNISLKYLETGKPICVPGFNNKLLLALMKIIPRKMLYKKLVSRYARD